MRFFLLLILFNTSLWAQAKAPIDTLSIKGSLALKADIFVLEGSFSYTLYNSGSLAQNKWELVVNPSVNIISIRYNDSDLETISQLSESYRMLTVTLPSPLKPGERVNIVVRFSLLPQKDDPRFNLSAEGAFLDARRLWFPLPEGDLSLAYEISIDTPSNLQALMGGRLDSETSGYMGNHSRWVSELDNIALSGSLIITSKIRYKQEDLYLYGSDQNTHLQAFLPYWKAIREKNPYFPLSELHIFPLDINIPGKGDDFADGEFIGNILLLDQKLVQAALQNPEGNFTWAGGAQKRLNETLIHELFHAYLPGLLSYSAEEAYIIEGFIQYLSWSMIRQLDPAWAGEISRRNRFLMLNLLCTRDTRSPVWKYLLSSTLFAAAFEQSTLKGLALINTLAEKYSHTQFVLADIAETAEIHQTLAAVNDNIYPEFLNEFRRTFLYNTSLQVFHTNLLGSKQTASILRVRHTLPKAWRGTISWHTKGEKITNSLYVNIPSGSTWVSNIPGQVSYAVLQAPSDDLEQFLGDNSYSPKDLGRQFIDSLNSGLLFDTEYRKKNNFDIPTEMLERLQSYQDLKLSYLWDNTSGGEIQAYLVNNKNIRKAFISFFIVKIGKTYQLKSLINPLEQGLIK